MQSKELIENVAKYFIQDFYGEDNVGQLRVKEYQMQSDIDVVIIESEKGYEFMFIHLHKPDNDIRGKLFICPDLPNEISIPMYDPITKDQLDEVIIKLDAVINEDDERLVDSDEVVINHDGLGLILKDIEKSNDFELIFVYPMVEAATITEDQYNNIIERLTSDN